MRKEKKKKEKRFGFEHCVRIESGSVRVWNFFHAWFWRIFPLLSHLSICSTPCPQHHYNFENSFWSWFACVFVF